MYKQRFHSQNAVAMLSVSIIHCYLKKPLFPPKETFISNCKTKYCMTDYCINILTLTMRLCMPSQTGSALKRAIAQFAAVRYSQVNRFLMFSQVLFDIKYFLAVIALK